MATSNGWGGRRTTLAKLMRDHDALPQPLRLVDCSTTAKWSADSIRAAWAATPPGASVNQRMVIAADLLDRASGDDTWRSYGPHHPECPPQFRGKKPPKGAWWAEQNRRAK